MNIVKMPDWEITGGETLVLAGANAVATLPQGTTIVQIAAEGANVSYAFGPIASALSPGFVPENGRVVEGPLRDFNNLSCFGGADAIAHLIYYRENRGK